MAEIKTTLCWDCANATNGCSWAKELKPVKGWKAEFIEKPVNSTYHVYECPEFIRDAIHSGQKRCNK